MPSIVKSKGESNFKPVPAGTHIARCVCVVNLGLQDSGKWGAQPKHHIGFEVPSVRVNWEKDGEQHEGPAIIGQRYTSSLSTKANLRKHLESWRGRPFTETELNAFDLFNLLNVPCMISVTHNESGGNVYANISAIMGLPAGTEAPPRETDLLKFDVADPDAASDLKKLPEWMQKAINTGLALAEHQSENPAPMSTTDDFDDDIPF